MQNEIDQADCPECGAPVRMRSPFLGQQVPCRQCGTLLEVVRRHPVALDICELGDGDPMEETLRRRRMVRDRRRNASPQYLSEDRY